MKITCKYEELCSEGLFIIIIYSKFFLICCDMALLVGLPESALVDKSGAFP
jgi:hypothetical protein